MTAICWPYHTTVFFEFYWNYSIIIYLHNVHGHFTAVFTLLKKSLDSKIIKMDSNMKLHGVAKFNTYRCINSMYSAVHVKSSCFSQI